MQTIVYIHKGGKVNIKELIWKLQKFEDQEMSVHIPSEHGEGDFVDITNIEKIVDGFQRDPKTSKKDFSKPFYTIVIY